MGIDIGTGQIKIVELQKNRGNFELKNYAVLNIAVDSEEVIQTSSLNMLEGDVILRIKNLIKQAGIIGKEVVMSISSFSAFSTLIEMPKMPEHELAKAIEFEARRYIPIPLREVHLDWAIIGDKKKESVDNLNRGKTAEKYEILLVALPNDLLKKYEKISFSIGIKLKSLELETFALTRALIGDTPNPMLLVDLGKRSTTLSIVEQGVVLLSKNLDIGGNEISRGISRALNISFERAETMKHSMELTGDNSLKKVVSMTLDIIISEINRLLDIYFQKHQKKAEKIILTGGMSNLKGFGEYFQTKLNLPIEKGNPWRNINYPKVLEPALTDLASVLSVAVGLALRGDA